jgi:hypothetical protein
MMMMMMMMITFWLRGEERVDIINGDVMIDVGLICYFS